MKTKIKIKNKWKSKIKIKNKQKSKNYFETYPKK